MRRSIYACWLLNFDMFNFDSISFVFKALCFFNMFMIKATVLIPIHASEAMAYASNGKEVLEDSIFPGL